MIEPTPRAGLLRRAASWISRCPTGPLSYRILIASVAALLAAPLLPAQSSATGVVEGRVQNAVTGDYLTNARVSVRGTNRVALTDSAGYYQLTDVPAGDVALRVFFTGLDEQETKISVTAGQSVAADFKLTSVARYGKDADT